MSAAAINVIDETHDPKRRSWVASANGHPDFPIQNLPLGVFSPRGKGPRGGVAIGDAILDLATAVEAGLFSGEAKAGAEAGAGATLNALMGMKRTARVALRKRVSDILSVGGNGAEQAQGLADKLIHRAADCTMHLPADVGDYTDFFCGIHHAAAGGRINRPGTDPLSPNYKYLPVAYHGRASSVGPSGVTVRRPNGQRLRGADTVPTFGPCEKLDYEFEFGVWIGPGNGVGEPVAIANAHEHIAGYCMLNDWSARDIQRWEMAPLGPFLSKNFRTMVSPWVVTAEALAPFRVAQPARPAGDPRPLPYLWDDEDQRVGALDIALEALIVTPGLRQKGLPPHRVSLANTTDLYWTFAQMVAHHTCGGCNLAPGDLFGSGTISGATEDGCGCLMERSENGRKSIALASGETRTFLEDGDEVIFRATCRRDGFAPIGFGECRGTVAPAQSSG